MIYNEIIEKINKKNKIIVINCYICSCKYVFNSLNNFIIKNIKLISNKLKKYKFKYIKVKKINNYQNEIIYDNNICIIYIKKYNNKQKINNCIEINQLTYVNDNIKKILHLIKTNVYGKIIEKNKIHCGYVGHILEKLLGIIPNSRNNPDIFGYELKKMSPKITFGDWSANYYIFNDTKYKIKNMDNFIKIFGRLNQKKNRYSWSGVCVPKYGIWNKYGQKMTIDKNNNILILYCYKHDERNNRVIKELLNISDENQEIIIVKWLKNNIEKKVNNKFNCNGFFIVNIDNNKFSNVIFGKKITFEIFLNGIKNKKIFFDSGMYLGNKRKYSHWRGYISFWKNLFIQEFL